jgi:hypothetical protein
MATPPAVNAPGNVRNNAAESVVTLTPTFKLVFLSVLGITLICLMLAVFIALHQQTDATKNLNDKLLSVFTLGCGAIIGLLGGKTLN